MLYLKDIIVVILRLGTFHTICDVMSNFGTHFQDASLRDFFIEAGIIAEDSVHRVMDEKMYSRAVRMHKSIYEAIMRLVWIELIP